MTHTPPPFRLLPYLDELNEFFWTSGADGVLRMLHCTACSYVIHPPAPYCPTCGSTSTEPRALSGRGTLYSYTVNHQPWDGVGDLYLVALVELEEQSDVRLMTNLVDIEPEDVRIGMPVEVFFEERENDPPVYLPLFRPAGGTRTEPQAEEAQQ